MTSSDAHACDKQKLPLWCRRPQSNFPLPVAIVPNACKVTLGRWQQALQGLLQLPFAGHSECHIPLWCSSVFGLPYRVYAINGRIFMIQYIHGVLKLESKQSLTTLLNCQAWLEA